MKRLIYFNKPMNIIVVIIREYTKKSRRHWTKPPPPQETLCTCRGKTGRTLEVLLHIK